MTKSEAISQIRAGKLAIENDGTVQQLRRIITIIWPNDKGTVTSKRKLYLQNDDFSGEWRVADSTNLPTIKATALAELEDINVTQLKVQGEEEKRHVDYFKIHSMGYYYGDKKELPNCLQRDIHEEMFYWKRHMHPNQKYDGDAFDLSLRATQAVKVIHEVKHLLRSGRGVDLNWKIWFDKELDKMLTNEDKG